MFKFLALSENNNNEATNIVLNVACIANNIKQRFKIICDKSVSLGKLSIDNSCALINSTTKITIVDSQAQLDSAIDCNDCDAVIFIVGFDKNATYKFKPNSIFIFFDSGLIRDKQQNNVLKMSSKIINGYDNITHFYVLFYNYEVSEELDDFFINFNRVTRDKLRICRVKLTDEFSQEISCESAEFCNNHMYYPIAAYIDYLKISFLNEIGTSESLTKIEFK
jgi:hypothetical protein